MHARAVDAAALLDHHHQPLVIGIGLGQILPQVQEGFVYPGRQMQPVIAQFGAMGRQGQGHKCRGKHNSHLNPSGFGVQPIR